MIQEMCQYIKELEEKSEEKYLPRGEDVDKAICEIMVKYGPDRHVDGHKYITAYIMELLKERNYI